MTRWERRTKGWLRRYKPKKELTGEEKRPACRPQITTEGYAVVFIPLKCPKCQSKNVRCYKSDPPVRYHKCRDCSWKFKSVEK